MEPGSISAMSGLGKRASQLIGKKRNGLITENK